MKNIVIGVVVVALVVGAYVFFGTKKEAVVDTTIGGAIVEEKIENTKPQVIETQVTDTNVLALVKKASVSVSESETGAKVTLVDGKATFAIDGSSIKGSVTAGDVATAKSFKGRNDVIAVMNVNPDGKGASQLLVLFENKSNVLNQKSIAFLGQNVVVKSIVTTDLANGGAEDYAIVVTALIGKNTNPTRFIFTVEGGEINPAKSLTL